MTSPSTINGQFVGLDEGEKREKNKINAHHLNKDFEYLICFFCSFCLTWSAAAFSLNDTIPSVY